MLPLIYKPDRRHVAGGKALLEGLIQLGILMRALRSGGSMHEPFSDIRGVLPNGSLRFKRIRQGMARRLCDEAGFAGRDVPIVVREMMKSGLCNRATAVDRFFKSHSNIKDSSRDLTLASGYNSR